MGDKSPTPNYFSAKELGEFRTRLDRLENRVKYQGQTIQRQADTIRTLRAQLTRRANPQPSTRNGGRPKPQREASPGRRTSTAPDFTAALDELACGSVTP